MRSYNIHAAEQKKVLLDAKIDILILCIMSVSVWIGPLSETQACQRQTTTTTVKQESL